MPTSYTVLDAKSIEYDGSGSNDGAGIAFAVIGSLAFVVGGGLAIKYGVKMGRCYKNARGANASSINPGDGISSGKCDSAGHNTTHSMLIEEAAGYKDLMWTFTAVAGGGAFCGGMSAVIFTSNN